MNVSRKVTPLERHFFQHLETSLPDHGLFAEKSWRQSPEPFFISSAHQQSLEQLGHRLHQFNQACDLLYRLSFEGRQPSWIATLLDQGKPEELVTLSRSKQFQGETARIIRPDLLLTEEGWTICELDQVPGGIGLTAWLQDTYASLGFSMLGGTRGMLEGFQSILEGGDILISEEAATYRPEMQYLTERLNKELSGSSDPRWRVLSTDNHGPWGAHIYRFFELFDLKNVASASALFKEALAGKLTITPPPKPQLEEKLWFGLFWMKPLEAFWIRQLSQRGWEQLKKVIPYTWILDPSPLPPQAVYPKLEVQSWEQVASFSQQERNLVIKVSGFDERAWGSRGVIIGGDVSKKEWEEALRDALGEYHQHPHLLQVFHHSKLQSCSYFNNEEEIVEMKGRVRLTPYYFTTPEKVTLGGALATVCPADKKILHGMSDAILMPVAVEARG